MASAPARHLRPERVVVGGSCAAQQRQRVERRHLVVGRELLVQPLHGLHVGDAPGAPVGALRPQVLDRLEEALLTRRRRLGQPRCPVGPEPRQDRPRVLRVLLGVERVVVAERLAPVGHREVGLELLRRLELRRSPASSRSCAGWRRRAGSGSAPRPRRRGGERQVADVLELRQRRSGTQHQADDGRDALLASHLPRTPWSDGADSTPESAGRQRKSARRRRGRRDAWAGR